MALSIKELITQYKEKYDYCEEQYMLAWQAIVADIDENASESRKTAARRDAQKIAIDKAFIQSMAHFPDIDEEVIWALNRMVEFTMIFLLRSWQGMR